MRRRPAARNIGLPGEAGVATASPSRRRDREYADTALGTVAPIPVPCPLPCEILQRMSQGRFPKRPPRETTAEKMFHPAPAPIPSANLSYVLRACAARNLVPRNFFCAPKTFRENIGARVRRRPAVLNLSASLPVVFCRHCGHLANDVLFDLGQSVDLANILALDDGTGIKDDYKYSNRSPRNRPWAPTHGHPSYRLNRTTKCTRVAQLLRQVAQLVRKWAGLL